jgi:hypothetical protein
VCTVGCRDIPNCVINITKEKTAESEKITCDDESELPQRKKKKKKKSFFFSLFMLARLHALLLASVTAIHAAPDVPAPSSGTWGNQTQSACEVGYKEFKFKVPLTGSAWVDYRFVGCSTDVSGGFSIRNANGTRNIQFGPYTGGDCKPGVWSGIDINDALAGYGAGEPFVIAVSISQPDCPPGMGCAGTDSIMPCATITVLNIPTPTNCDGTCGFTYPQGCMSCCTPPATCFVNPDGSDYCCSVK